MTDAYAPFFQQRLVRRIDTFQYLKNQKGKSPAPFAQSLFPLGEAHGCMVAGGRATQGTIRREREFFRASLTELFSARTRGV
jgi:hypothetical protein